MDPSTRLDHAVFQLTPTRTRCDLLVCSAGKGGAYEKIASGLLEPFLTHLRCAREQVPKGGYSFTLRPPPATTRGSPSSGGGGGGRGDEAAAYPPTAPNWFTKGTLERFVRFVSTPEILERVAAIEKEIVNIESCVHPPAAAAEDDAAATPTTTLHEASAGGTGKAEHQGSASSYISGDDKIRKLNSPSKLKVEANGQDAAAYGESSKLCLQQTLETRKAVLLKEQSMAYARAAVAGYEMDNIEDLVSFADAFGASRLREACMTFKDICEKKEKDKIWLDELAAIGTYSHSDLSGIGPSGIMLTGGHSELNGTFSDTITDPTIPAANSNAGEDNNGRTPNREPWRYAGNGIYPEKYQIPIGWPSHPPQYMYNFPNPAQQLPPCQGYAFTGALPPYPPGQFDNAQQPPFKEVSDHVVSGDGYSCQRYRKSSSSNHIKPVKMKAGRSTTSRSRDGERSHDSSNSGSESDGHIQHDASEDEVLGKGWDHKRSHKKASKTVLIRNINIISSERRDGEDGSTSASSVEGGINEGFLKQKVENIVDSLKKYQQSSDHQHKRKGKNKNHRNMHDDDNSFDQNVEIHVNAKDSNTKGDKSWHAFQSILMRDESSSAELHEKNNRIPSDSNEQYHVYSGDELKNTHLATSFVHDFPLEVESLEGTRPRLIATDPIAANAKDDNYKNKGCSQIFDGDENYSTRMNRSHNADEELLFSEKSKSGIVTPDDITTYANETVTPNLQMDADCFVVSKSSFLQDGEHTAEYLMFEGDQNVKSLDGISNDKIRNELPIDDSFVVTARSTVDEHLISHWETDMSIMSGLAFAAEVESVGVASHSIGSNRASDKHEPDDLQMILERNTENEPVGTSWTPEMDYSPDITFNVVKESDSVHEANVSIEPPNPKGALGEGNPRNKPPVKDSKSKSVHGPLTKAKSEIILRKKKPSAISREEIERNKMNKEEENRKRIEELLVQRQKRIAERSSSSTTSPAMTKVSAVESNLRTGSSKHEKKAARPIQGNSRSSLLHRMEVTSLAKNSHAPDQCKKNKKVAAVAI